MDFEELCTSWVPQHLAQLIEQKFSEDESFMVQIGMSEVLENIRNGVLLLKDSQVSEEQKTEESIPDIP